MKKQSPAQLQAAIVALSGQLANTLQELNLERVEHIKFTNQLRAQVLGFKELPLDTKAVDLVTFRDDLLRFLTKIVQVAERRETVKKEDKNPVGAPFLA